MSKKVICPVCDEEAGRVRTKFGWRHSCCGQWSWNGKPLADAETHEARKAAHASFDPLWTGGAISRSAAYDALAQELGLERDECHMSLMDAATAQRVPLAVMRIMGRLAQ